MGILHVGILWKAKMYENVKPAYLSLSNFIFRNLCQGNTQKSVQRYFYGTRTQKTEKGSLRVVESLTKSIAAQGPCDCCAGFTTCTITQYEQMDPNSTPQ